ncbi:hypothetical protein COV93_08400 [Candidatus Woesearchaeota archaeon CG11_big_fil_rev_8_21_14_0_20_43_8]|nr:MAG: hypothetical protein COV93_08400 [Candidatus Woesearchaeota archaeon CG11_big_fil_rev_8_21_14_0_20_43_8]PIO08888.1 MAG: hypothetical protein COT47_00755 [Candidatus Woesearchaeota archaeon CG08_land_8_20_14_0_20_43_7]
MTKKERKFLARESSALPLRTSKSFQYNGDFFVGGIRNEIIFNLNSTIYSEKCRAEIIRKTSELLSLVSNDFNTKNKDIISESVGLIRHTMLKQANDIIIGSKNDMIILVGCLCDLVLEQKCSKEQFSKLHDAYANIIDILPDEIVPNNLIFDKLVSFSGSGNQLGNIASGRIIEELKTMDQSDILRKFGLN